MQHLPIVVLLALCAFLVVAHARASCDVRQQYFKGYGCGDRIGCVYGSLNETVCAVYALDDGSAYSALVNCSTKVLSLYNNANCTGDAATLSEGECLPSSPFSLSVSFASTCSSAALIQSWISYLF